jgi:hypothetical protein
VIRKFRKVKAVPRRKMTARALSGPAGSPQKREVVELRVRARQEVVVELVVVGLDAVVGVVAALVDGEELRAARPAERPVEAVVAGVGGDQRT